MKEELIETLIDIEKYLRLADCTIRNNPKRAEHYIIDALNSISKANKYIERNTKSL